MTAGHCSPERCTAGRATVTGGRGLPHVTPRAMLPWRACRYGELTGQRVEGCRFSVLRDDDVHGWLGASPDGLIEGLLAQPGAGGARCTIQCTL